MQSSTLHRLFWGLVVTAIGVLFLLDQFETVTFDIGDLFFDYWPVFIIFFGLQGLLLQRKGGMWWNPIVILVGVVFLGNNLEWFSLDIGQLWPVFLIVFGISMVFGGSCTKKRGKQDDRSNANGWNPVSPPPVPPHPFQRQEHRGPPPAPPISDDPDASFTNGTATGASERRPDESMRRPEIDQRHSWEYREERKAHREERRAHHKRAHHQWHDPNSETYSRFIGDVHLGNDYWELRPLNVSMFIGDTTLDLTKAQIPLGETRVYVSSFIGDVKVFVPNDMTLGIQVVSSCLIGDVSVLERKREGLFNQIKVETAGFVDTEKRIVLVVSAFIGDVRVTKVG